MTAVISSLRRYLADPVGSGGHTTSGQAFVITLCLGGLVMLAIWVGFDQWRKRP